MDKPFLNAEKIKKFFSIGALVVAVIIVFIAVAMFYTKNDDSKKEAVTIPPVGVHIKGAVVNSGYYEVPRDSRVKDIGKYAGGFLPEADLNSINLAQFITDGQELYIPYKGTEETGAFNLNTITEKELDEEVEGIGTIYAKKIIEYRITHNGFREVIELKSIIPEELYNKISSKFYVE